MPTVGVWVNVTIAPEIEAEFLKVMDADVKGSRAEDGCLRFDLLKLEEPGKYAFYEIYKDADAAALHKTLPHYLGWAEFKKANPSVGASQTVAKFELVGEP